MIIGGFEFVMIGFVFGILFFALLIRGMGYRCSKGEEK